MPPALSVNRPTGQCPLLVVSSLDVTYNAASGCGVPALRDISFTIKPGEILGVLGESGCGKSTLALSLLRLFPPNTEAVGEIFFQDSDLLHLRETELRSIRGANISLIYQEPSLSLCPVMRVGHQIAEVLRAHCQLGRTARHEKITSILESMHFREIERIYRAYPHELSGGELNRVAIAQALVCQPDLLIADEPTRALDVITQSEIIRLLLEFNQTKGTAILFITHNPAVLVGFAHRVLVMYGGHIVEEGTLPQVFERPRHPYTQGLLSLVPQSLRYGCRREQAPLATIPDLITDSSPSAEIAHVSGKRAPICADKHPQDIAPEDKCHVSCFHHGN